MTMTITTRNVLYDYGAFSTDSYFVTGITSVVQTTFLCGHNGPIRVRDEHADLDTDRLSMQQCPACRKMLLQRQRETPGQYGYRGGPVKFDGWLRGWEYDDHGVPTTLYPLVEIAGLGHAEIRFAGTTRAHAATDTEAMQKALKLIAAYVDEARNGTEHLITLRIPLATELI